jgi:hypothetical protein
VFCSFAAYPFKILGDMKGRLPIRDEMHSRETPMVVDARHSVAGRLQLLRNGWIVLPLTVILHQV